MKNTGSHNGYLRFAHEANGGKSYGNQVNQSKQYRIYIKESKSWVDVNKEFYTNYYRDINSYRKRQQEHGRCVCPASKRYLCDMDCMTCPYAKAGDQLSLDNTVSDGEGNEKSWLDDMPDESVAIVEMIEDAELLRALYAKLNELDPEGRLICQLIMEGNRNVTAARKWVSLVIHSCIAGTSCSRSFVPSLKTTSNMNGRPLIFQGTIFFSKNFLCFFGQMAISPPLSSVRRNKATYRKRGEHRESDLSQQKRY